MQSFAGTVSAISTAPTTPPTEVGGASHVIPANAGIQEATPLAESHAFGFVDVLRLAPPHRGPWIPAFAGNRVNTSFQRWFGGCDCV
jgi:hypothetical protein